MQFHYHRSLKLLAKKKPISTIDSWLTAIVVNKQQMQFFFFFLNNLNNLSYLNVLVGTCYI